MGRKSKKSKATSGKGPIDVAKVEVDKAKPVPTKEPKQTSTPKNGGDVAVGAVCEFYDKLVELPLEEKLAALLSHHLITRSTLERVDKPIHIRTEKNRFILQDVLAAVQQRPDMLEVFCNVLRDIYIAAELAQLVQDKYDEDLNSLKDTPMLHTTSFKPGLSWCDNILQGKGVVMVLVLIFVVTVYIMIYHTPKLLPGDKIPAIPDIPTAFTGRNDEIESLIHYVVAEHVRIVGVTGGPGYGKSSIVIVSSHELVQRGIPVYYVSLSEVNSIETFIMAFLHATDKRKTEQMPERCELLSWVSLLKTKTVVVLDNADLLTLRDNDLKNDFQKLLKDVVAGSVYIHLVVATRYRLIIANDFEEIHLNPLTSTEAVTLLRRVVVPQGQNRRGGYVEDEHLESIANRTGGIPLAIKVVGVLVKSRIVSTAQVLEELAVDPLHTFSRDSISPDEQLNRCFNLSYKYLSQTMRKCLIYASRLPGTFDRQARDAIITGMTGDAHCLDQLVDRSLVEYSTVEERYAMHSLLRTFVLKSVKGRSPEDKYFCLFCNHFTLLLSSRMTEASTGGDVNPLYATITADYHNFLHLLRIYTNESKDHTMSCMAHKDMLLLASQAFDVMKPRFPWELLMDWWTAILKNVCRRILISEFEQLAAHFLQLSTKLGNLLLYHQQHELAGKVLLFADQCVNNTTLAASFTTCQHPEADSYTSMLQVLMKVSEGDRLVRIRERLHHCVDSAPDKKPEALITDNFCTVGISYLQEKHSQNKHFYSALQLFDAQFKCFNWDEANNLITVLEDSFEYQLQDSHGIAQFRRAFSIAKRCRMVRNVRKEVEWLTKAAKHAEFALFEPPLGKAVMLFSIHIHLNRLYWLFFNNAEKAVEHGKAAYYLAVKYYHAHDGIWAASLRLADILHQIDGSQAEAAFYFEEALKHSLSLSTDEEVIYRFQKFAELSLISMEFHAGEYRSCMQHYGQWAKLEATNVPIRVRKVVEELFSEPVQACQNANCLVVMDDSVDRLLGDADTARRYIEAFSHKTQKFTMYFAKVLYVILSFGIPFLLFIRMLCNNLAFFHLFCPNIKQISAIILLLFIVLATFTMHTTGLFGLYLLLEQVELASSPSTYIYNNMSMYLNMKASLYDLSDIH